MYEVRFCNPPAYDEIGVKALYDQVVSQPELKPYFPDSFPKGQRCEKGYMFNVWNTIRSDQVEATIKEANRQRYTVESKDVKENSINLTANLEKEL